MQSSSGSATSSPSSLDPRQRLLALERERARRAARLSLLPFTLWTFPGYEVNWHHRAIADRLTDVVEGRCKRLILCVPPRRGKSELASRRLPAWALGRNPDLRVIACSFGADLASDNSRDVKRIMAEPAYRELFPETRLGEPGRTEGQAKNTADQWEIVGRQGSYFARGVGGGITGRGFNLGIIDDPIKDEQEARSHAYREALWTWYNKVFWTRRAPGAAIVVIMTRWHHDDLVGRLLDQARTNPDAEQWELVEFRELREGDDNPSDPRQLGEPLWPSHYPLLESVAARSVDPHGFASLYQQRPSPDEGNIILTEWTGRRWQQRPIGDGDWLQSWDLKAGSKDPRSSYAVGQVWFRPRGSCDCYLLDQVRGRWDVLETQEQIVALSRRWPLATRKLVEAKADGRAVVTMLQGHVPGLILVTPQGDKVSRARAVSPLFAGGNVVLPAQSAAPWVAEYVYELTTFPAAANDDQVDTTTQALSWFGSNEPATIVRVPVNHRFGRVV